MGAEPPFLYDAPSRSSTHDPYYSFNPKAVSQASVSPPPKSPLRMQQQGPLLDFNRHPDSYTIIPYGATDVQPMSPNTRKRVVTARWVQLSFRVLQLLATLGLLFCVICIRGAQDGDGWLLRIPPAMDALSSLYALYHLIRPAKARTPASSASYHSFALFIDAGFIPSYVFVAILANRNYLLAPGTDYRWRSLFSDDLVTGRIFYWTWIIAILNGAFHLISMALDAYLIVMFKKIAQMPPDLNPLEDNLTGQHISKHKHKNSNLSDIGTIINEKRRPNASTVSLSNQSQAREPLIPDATTMPFFQTRNDSSPSFSPHSPDTARMSRTDLAAADQVYQHPYATRNSYTDLHRRDNTSQSTIVSYPARSNPFVDALTTTNGSPRGPTPKASFLSALSEPASAYSAARNSATTSPAPQAAVTSSEAQRQQKQGLISDTRYVVDSPRTGASAASPSLHGSVSVANMANAWARDVSAPSTSTRPTHSPAPPSTTASSTSSGLSHPPSLASLQRSYPSSVYSEALDAAMERRMAPLSMHPPTAPDVASLAEPTILEDVPLHNADGSEAGIVRNGTTV
ncbi:hypothetical protein B0A49_00484, partial [Cryomyces minteri]